MSQKKAISDFTFDTCDIDKPIKNSKKKGKNDKVNQISGFDHFLTR